MKSTGIVRRVDELGRIVIPKEVRKSHGWKPGTPFEMFMTEEGFLIRPYKVRCAVCGSFEGLIKVNDRCICSNCLEEAKKEIPEGV